MATVFAADCGFLGAVLLFSKRREPSFIHEAGGVFCPALSLAVLVPLIWAAVQWLSK
jgi:hypothetical protein